MSIDDGNAFMGRPSFAALCRSVPPRTSVRTQRLDAEDAPAIREGACRLQGPQGRCSPIPDPRPDDDRRHRRPRRDRPENTDRADPTAIRTGPA